MKAFALRLLGWRWALLWALLLAGGSAQSHELTLAEMSVREMAPGEFVWGWRTPGKAGPIPEGIAPVWPAGCQAEGQSLVCQDGTLKGVLSAKGLGDNYSALIFRIRWRDGQESVHTVTAAQPKAQLLGAADDQRGMGEVASAYVMLGVEHILSGIDHLLFVISLLFLVGFRRKLVGTITAFTVAHSLTLAASALGWLVLRPPPVEACIALSIVLVSAEALNRRETATRQWPALVAFVFGLVHGLGFAGALQEIGLPRDHTLVALLTFNAGVEVGQLLVVLAAWGLFLALRRQRWAGRLRWPVLYVIGTVATYWSFLRMVAMVA